MIFEPQRTQSGTEKGFIEPQSHNELRTPSSMKKRNAKTQRRKDAKTL
jgi:hypothetical protein